MSKLTCLVYVSPLCRQNLRGVSERSRNRMVLLPCFFAVFSRADRSKSVLKGVVNVAPASVVHLARLSKTHHGVELRAVILGSAHSNIHELAHDLRSAPNEVQACCDVSSRMSPIENRRSTLVLKVRRSIRSPSLRTARSRCRRSRISKKQDASTTLRKNTSRGRKTLLKSSRP